MPPGVQPTRSPDPSTRASCVASRPARRCAYQPDYTRLLFEEIRPLIEENSREELRNELAAITEEIEEWQATYNVETWEDLEQSLADGDLTSDELHERRDVITRWEENLEDRRLIKHALVLYSDVEAAREQRVTMADRVTNQFQYSSIW